MMIARSMWTKSFLTTTLAALGVAIAMVISLGAGAQTAWAEVQAAASDGLSAGGSGSELTEPTKSLTAWANDYENQGNCVNSYLSLVTLYGDEGGSDAGEARDLLQRVEYVEGTGLVVEFYDPDTFEFVSGRIIDPETYRFKDMPADKEIIWGGYYHDADANYVVTGQANTEESTTMPVVRVTMYNRNWVPIAVNHDQEPVGDNIRALEISDINTRVPFSGGSCRIIENGGNLWIYTCHEMFDGRGQANMILLVEKDYLDFTDSYSGYGSPDPWDSSRFNYVSRSFNQFITYTGEHVFTLDQSDAYPERAFVLGNLDGLHTYTNLPRFAGSDGDSETYAAIGGLEASGANKNYVVMVGKINGQTSTDQAAGTPYKAWISVVDATPLIPQDPNGGQGSDADGGQGTGGSQGADGAGSGQGADSSQGTDGDQGDQDPQSSSPEYTWLADSETETASVPFLVKVDDDTFMVAWGTKPSTASGATYGAQVNYRFIELGDDAFILGETYTMSGVIGDCQPIVHDGKVIWYATGKPADNTAAQTTYAAAAPAFYGVDVETKQPVVVNPFDKATIAFDKQEYVYTGSQIKPQVTIKIKNETLVQGTDYTLEYGKNVDAGTGSIVIKGAGTKYEGFERTLSFTIQPASIEDAEVNFDPVQKYTGKPVMPKVTVKLGGKTLVQNTDFVVAYQNNVDIGRGILWVFGMGNYSISTYQGFYFYITDGLDLATPKQVKVALTGAKGFKVTWQKVKGATQYAVYRNGALAATTSADNWTDTSDKVNGGQYLYQVVAYSDFDKSGKSAAASTYFFTRVKVKSAKSLSSRRVTVKWTKNALAGGYQVRYKLGKTTKIVSVKKPTTLKKVLKGLKSRKTYKVQVRVVRQVGKQTYYSAWSAVKKVKVRK